MKELTNDEFNSWACDIANDYAQAMQEMCAEDYESQDDYFLRRMKDAGIKPPKAYVKRKSPVDADQWVDADDDLPF